MNSDLYTPVSGMLNIFVEYDSYDIFTNVEMVINQFVFGVDYCNKKILISKYAFEAITEVRECNCYTTKGAVCFMRKIFRNDFLCDYISEYIPIYVKYGDEYVKYTTIEIFVSKDSEKKIGSVVGIVKILENELGSEIGELKTNQNLHDVKNQLMAIASISSTIEKNTDNKKIIDYTYNIKDAVYNCNYLIDETRGKTIPNFKNKVDVHELLNYHISVVEMEDNIDTHYFFEAENSIVRGNCVAISNVLQNILLNAVQAIDEKGSITINTKTIVKSTSQNNKAKKGIAVHISDNGSGIDKSIIKDIFDYSFTTKEFGSGLGLYTAKQTINAHKGTLTVESEVGLGTTFTIFLPNA